MYIVVNMHALALALALALVCIQPAREEFFNVACIIYNQVINY